MPKENYTVRGLEFSQYGSYQDLSYNEEHNIYHLHNPKGTKYQEFNLGKGITMGKAYEFIKDLVAFHARIDAKSIIMAHIDANIIRE
jgi:hypothetical protein